MHLCSKSPVQPQGKYLDNNSFVCTLGDAVKSRYKGKKGKREKRGKEKREWRVQYEMAMGACNMKRGVQYEKGGAV